MKFGLGGQCKANQFKIKVCDYQLSHHDIYTSKRYITATQSNPSPTPQITPSSQPQPNQLPRNWQADAEITSLCETCNSYAELIDIYMEYTARCADSESQVSVQGIYAVLNSLNRLVQYTYVNPKEATALTKIYTLVEQDFNGFIKASVPHELLARNIGYVLDLQSLLVNKLNSKGIPIDMPAILAYFQAHSVLFDAQATICVLSAMDPAEVPPDTVADVVDQCTQGQVSQRDLVQALTVVQKSKSDEKFADQLVEKLLSMRIVSVQNIVGGLKALGNRPTARGLEHATAMLQKVSDRLRAGDARPTDVVLAPEALRLAVNQGVLDEALVSSVTVELLDVQSSAWRRPKPLRHLLSAWEVLASKAGLKLSADQVGVILDAAGGGSSRSGAQGYRDLKAQLDVARLCVKLVLRECLDVASHRQQALTQYATCVSRAKDRKNKVGARVLAQFRDTQMEEWQQRPPNVAELADTLQLWARTRTPIDESVMEQVCGHITQLDGCAVYDVMLVCRQLKMLRQTIPNEVAVKVMELTQDKEATPRQYAALICEFCRVIKADSAALVVPALQRFLGMTTPGLQCGMVLSALAAARTAGALPADVAVELKPVMETLLKRVSGMQNMSEMEDAFQLAIGAAASLGHELVDRATVSQVNGKLTSILNTASANTCCVSLWSWCQLDDDVESGMLQRVIDRLAYTVNDKNEFMTIQPGLKLDQGLVGACWATERLSGDVAAALEHVLELAPSRLCVVALSSFVQELQNRNERYQKYKEQIGGALFNKMLKQWEELKITQRLSVWRSVRSELGESDAALEIEKAAIQFLEKNDARIMFPTLYQKLQLCRTIQSQGWRTQASSDTVQSIGDLLVSKMKSQSYSQKGYPPYRVLKLLQACQWQGSVDSLSVLIGEISDAVPRCSPLYLEGSQSALDNIDVSIDEQIKEKVSKAKEMIAQQQQDAQTDDKSAHDDDHEDGGEEEEVA